MSGVVVCHGSAAVRERLVVTAVGVPTLGPVRAASTVDELLTLARRMPPTLVLLDAHLPAPGSIEAIRRLRGVAPSAAVVLLAAPDDAAALDRALALGARGFLAPDVGRPEMSAVAAHVLASPVLPGTRTATVDVPHPVPSAESDATDGVPASVLDTAAAVAAPPAPAALPPIAPLTKREIEVLSGMSYGRSNAQIGQELFLSEDTVKTHARRLFRKLGAKDRAQAVAIGLRRGLIR
jgi:two-component system, NarL family, nitrate/nitrite response regulator NarL